jgi:hypothetical protein
LMVRHSPSPHSARKARCPTAALRVKIPAPAVTIAFNWWHLTSGTRLRGRDKMYAHTRRREPDLPRSAAHRHPLRELSTRRTSGRNCSEEFLLSLADKNTQRAPDRDRLQLRAAEAGRLLDCPARVRRDIAPGRFRARRNRQAERSHPQRGLCRRQRPAPERAEKHSQSRRQRRE